MTTDPQDTCKPGNPDPTPHDINDMLDPGTTGQAVIVGRFSDGSGISDWVYGPFPTTVAETRARALTSGYWHYMEWTAVPLAVWPDGPQL